MLQVPLVTSLLRPFHHQRLGLCSPFSFLQESLQISVHERRWRSTPAVMIRATVGYWYAHYRLILLALTSYSDTTCHRQKFKQQWSAGRRQWEQGAFNLNGTSEIKLLRSFVRVKKQKGERHRLQMLRDLADFTTNSLSLSQQTSL